MLAKAKHVISEQKELIRFLALAMLLLVTWVLISAFFPSIIGNLHYYIIKPQAEISAYILRLFGYVVEENYLVNACEAQLVFTGHGSIYIGSGCSGLELFLLFFGFILLMKGRLKDKLWFIPLGFLGILILNIIRITGLSMIYFHHPNYLDFNHKFTFVVIVYGAIFGLWILWVNKYADKK